MLDAIAVATRSRSRSVTRARGRTAVAVWVNVLRGHNASRTDQPAFPPPQLDGCPEAGRSFNRIHGRSFTAPLTTPHAGHGPSRAVCSMIDLHGRGIDPLHLENAELVLKTEQH